MDGEELEVLDGMVIWWGENLFPGLASCGFMMELSLLAMQFIFNKNCLDDVVPANDQKMLVVLDWE